MKRNKQRAFILEVCAIEQNQADSTKVKISPVGNVTGVDGRYFEIEPQQLVNELNQSGLKLPLTINHGWDAKYGGESGGWFDDFESRDDGIYAKLERNDLGDELIEKKRFLYLSPEYLTDNTNRVVALVGVGLVNQPNLLNEALNHITQEDIVSKQTDNQDAGNNTEELDALRTQNQQLSDQVADLTKQLKIQRVDNAITNQQLLPAKREFALSLDANALDQFLTMEAPTAQAKTESNNIDQNQTDDADCPILAQLNG